MLVVDKNFLEQSVSRALGPGKKSGFKNYCDVSKKKQKNNQNLQINESEI